MKLLFFLVLCSLLPLPARALTMEPGSDAATRSVEDLIKDYIDLPKGGTDWKVFAKTKSINVEGRDSDGMDFQYYKPEFQPELKSLDGKDVIIKGYMFPLDEAEKQKLFLFGPFPINCPFQYHVKSTLVVEVHADKHPVKFDYDPVTLKGTLQLVDKDPENSTFYRLIDAQVVK